MATKEKKHPKPKPTTRKPRTKKVVESLEEIDKELESILSDEEPKEVEEQKVEEPKEEAQENVIELPEYDGSRVRYIMNDNRSNVTHHHCKMEDGTIKHVPIELFNEE